MTEIYTLFSGSSGNCVYIRSGEDRVLIDAGGNMKKIRTALKTLGCDLCDISAIFITHEHSDHISALKIVEKYFDIPLYLHPGSMDYLSVNAPRDRMHPMEYGASVRIGSVTLTSFATPHDSITSCGYVINTPEGKYALATDMGFVALTVAGVIAGSKAVIIEANYDEKMLANGPYPYMLRRRIAGREGHLENSDCAFICEKLAHAGTKRFLLAHLSAENNLPSLALATVREYMDLHGASASVDVASRYEISCLIRDDGEEICYQ